MNYNLKKLLKLTEQPILSNYITEELKPYGECQLTKYNDGGMHFYLTCDGELTDEQIEEIRQIVLNFDDLKYIKLEKIKQLKQKATQAIEEKYPIWKQGNLRALKYGPEKLVEMEEFIDKIIENVNSLEKTILSKQKIETLELIDINLF